MSHEPPNLQLGGDCETCHNGDEHDNYEYFCYKHKYPVTMNLICDDFISDESYCLRAHIDKIKKGKK